MSGVLRAVDVNTGKAESLYCEHGVLLVRAAAGSNVELAPSSSERSGAPASCGAGADLAATLRDGIVVYPSTLPAAGAHALQSQLRPDKQQQLLGKESQLLTCELTNLTDEVVIVRLFDACMSSAASARKESSRSMRRAWKNKVAAMPAEVAAALESAAAADDEMDNAERTLAGEGDFEHSRLCWQLRPNEYRAVSYQHGVHWKYGIVAGVLADCVDAQKAAVHCQITFA